MCVSVQQTNGNTPFLVDLSFLQDNSRNFNLSCGEEGREGREGRREGGEGGKRGEEDRRRRVREKEGERDGER